MITDADIYHALKTVVDPELGQNIVDLGLVYAVNIDPSSSGKISILMTLTTPGCPFGPYFVNQVKEVVAVAAGLSIDAVEVNLTFDPPWTQDMMSEEIKLQLGL